METNKTQLQQVKNHLLNKGRITSWSAIQAYRITRLSEYIRILREQGFNITMKRINLEYPKWYGLYELKRK